MGKKFTTILVIVGILALLGTGFWAGKWYYTHDIVRPVVNPVERIKQIEHKEDSFGVVKHVIDSMNTLLVSARDSGKKALTRIRRENKVLEGKLDMIVSGAVDTSLHDPYPPSYMEEFNALKQYRENNRVKDSITDATMSGYEQQISNLNVQLTQKDSLYSDLRISFNQQAKENIGLIASNLNLQAKANATPKKAGNVVWKVISGTLAALLIYQSVK